MLHDRSLGQPAIDGPPTEKTKKTRAMMGILPAGSAADVAFAGGGRGRSWRRTVPRITGWMRSTKSS